MYIIYNLLGLLIFFLLIIPYYLYRLVREKGFTRRFRQSMGLIRRSEIEDVINTDCVWIHGASVGEIVATSPLVKEIKEKMPERKVLVSAFTVAGYNMAKQIIPEADVVIYFPLDLPWVSESIVRRIKPGIFMPVETELWPNFLRAIRKRNIPVMMVNGRISEKSVKSYRYLFGIWEDMLGTVTRFCMQSHIDADYISHLGADKSKIFVTGNTKFDQTYAEVTPEELKIYRTEMGLTQDDYPVIVAGSTHPTEEDSVIKAFVQLRHSYPAARLIIAPRKTGRAHEIGNLAVKAGFSTGYRSELKEMKGDRPANDVLILDTIGELGRIYALGDIVFVGGTLIHHGGHNVLEPAAHAKPIIVGGSMENFKDSYALLSKVGACRKVENAKELAEAFQEIADDDSLRLSMGEASMQVIIENRGAAKRSIKYLKEILDLAVVPTAVQAEYPISTKNLNDAGGGGLRHGDAVVQYLYHLYDMPNRPFYGWIILGMLRVLSYIYELGARTNYGLYKMGILKSTKLDCCVISIGNITVGGTGKTPTAQRVANMVSAMGYKVVILNRGYRSHCDEEMGVVSDGKKIYMTAYEAGDEAYLMAKMMPGIPVIIGKNRSITGKYAVEHLGAEVIIMDDGYQHWQVQRDLDIVLVDTINMFGNHCLLPRGILREPLSHLDRADMFLLTKTDQSSVLARKFMEELLESYNDKAPIVESIHHAVGFVEIADWYKGNVDSTIELSQLEGENVMVFSAIGNPSSFEQSLASVGLNILEALRYPDHHDYGMPEMQYIGERAEILNAKALITTGKDAVKIPTEFIYFNRSIPIYVLDMDIVLTKNKKDFENTIQKAVEKKCGKKNSKKQ